MCASVISEVGEEYGMAGHWASIIHMVSYSTQKVE